VLLALTTPAWLLIGQLCCFHWQLHREGLTTYAYILREQKRANEPAQPSCCARAAARLCNRAESVTKRNAHVPALAGANGAAPATASQPGQAAGKEQAASSTQATELQPRAAE
jgi:hypothetical protein